MLYKEAIEEELKIMFQELDIPLDALTSDQIHISLHHLMRPPVTIEIGSSVQEAIDLMIDHNIGSVFVVRDGILKGILRERDILLKISKAQGEDWSKTPVENFTTIEPQTLSFDDTLDVAMTHLAQDDYRHIPIIDAENRPVGIVSMRGIISYFVECLPQTLLALPIRSREGA